jgi:formylglycine-generating enzyme required for sulfatase activity
MSFASNGYGVYDMAGNVSEWVLDWYLENYYFYDSHADNPQGPNSGDSRVMRGGSWNEIELYLLAAWREGNYPYFTSSGIGLRCAASP